MRSRWTVAEQPDVAGPGQEISLPPLTPLSQSMPSPSLRAFLEYAFRPLYPAAAAWGGLSVSIWIFAPQLVQGPLAGVFWHAHEMLWGFVATVAVAFLMTAGANWTGLNPLHGRPLAVVCLLWLCARLLLLFGTGTTAFLLGAAAELLFFSAAAVAMLRAVHLRRNTRNYAVPWLIVALGLADLLFFRAVMAGDGALLLRALDAGMLVMGAIVLLVGRRVIPFFAMRAINGLQLPMLTRLGQFHLALCAAAAVLAIAGRDGLLAAVLVAIGVLALAQVIAWHPAAVWRKPLLWILYAGYAGTGAGFLLAGLHVAGWVARSAVHVHVIGMAGFTVLIIGMLTRTALGHLGRPLVLDRSMHASYALILAAAAARLIALVPGEWTPWSLRLAAIAWATAFGLYLWRFVPMMIRPRPDAPSVLKVATMSGAQLQRKA